MATLAEKIIQFNRNLSFKQQLPRGIRIMNPFEENPEAFAVMKRFYEKYYGDNRQRKFIIGINPGRFGAGQTGVPFTDSKHLIEKCGIEIQSVKSHEPSAVFIYDLIEKFGGPEAFYSRFYIHSICPLGFIRQNEKGNWINCNYYDFNDLFEAVKEFMVQSLKAQFDFGLDRETCFVLGRKNAVFLQKINEAEHLFNNMVVLEHPRYIQQYKSREKESYLSRFWQKMSRNET
jgi:hypothetical protein